MKKEHKRALVNGDMLSKILTFWKRNVHMLFYISILRKINTRYVNTYPKKIGKGNKSIKIFRCLEALA